VVKGVGRQGRRIKVRDSRPSPRKMPTTTPRICLDHWPAVSIRSKPATGWSAPPTRPHARATPQYSRCAGTLIKQWGARLAPRLDARLGPAPLFNLAEQDRRGYPEHTKTLIRYHGWCFGWSC